MMHGFIHDPSGCRPRIGPALPPPPALARARRVGPSSAPALAPARGPRGRGRKARRGDIRTAALLLLAEEPRNGYPIMQEVEERSERRLAPEPRLGLPGARAARGRGPDPLEESEGRKLFAITDAGRAGRRGARRSAPAPWEQMSDELQPAGAGARPADARGRRSPSRRSCAPAARRRCGGQARCWPETRRDLYRILADGRGGADARVSADE